MNEKSVPVRIGYLNLVSSLAVFVAEKKGSFKEAGIEYKTIPIASSNEIVDELLAGNLDCFAGASVVPVLAAELESPGKLKIFSVSEITAEKPFDRLLVKEDSDVRSLADLSGRRIGVFPGTTATNLLKKYLGDKGVDVSDITFVAMSPVKHLSALLEGLVDAVHAYEPTIATALSGKGVKELHGSVYAEMFSPNPISVSVASAAFLEEQLETAGKVIGALERAMKYMKEEDGETRDILAKAMELSEETAKSCVFLYMLGHEQIDPAVLQGFADMLTAVGELKGQVNAEGLLYR
jgi:ABC-type nitrate/sulfonate/bicarbonate transport system substrate-binding protein